MQGGLFSADLVPECVAIIGSRDDFVDLDLVRVYVRGLSLNTIVVSGGARGVDRVAESEARKRKLQVLTIRPDFERYPPEKAPMIRNKRIVQRCDRMVAFWNGHSPGTLNGIRHAERMEKPVLVIAWVLDEGLPWAPSTIALSCSEWRKSSLSTGKRMHENTA